MGGRRGGWGVGGGGLEIEKLTALIAINNVSFIYPKTSFFTNIVFIVSQTREVSKIYKRKKGTFIVDQFLLI